MNFQLLQGLIIGAVVSISLAMSLRHFFPNWSGQQLGRLANYLLQHPSRLLRWCGSFLHRHISLAGGCGTDSGCGSCKGCSPVSTIDKSRPQPIRWQ